MSRMLQLTKNPSVTKFRCKRPENQLYKMCHFHSMQCIRGYTDEFPPGWSTHFSKAWYMFWGSSSTMMSTILSSNAALSLTVSLMLQSAYSGSESPLFLWDQQIYNDCQITVHTSKTQLKQMILTIKIVIPFAEEGSVWFWGLSGSLPGTPGTEAPEQQRSHQEIQQSGPHG